MEKTELLFFVLATRDHWIVRSEDQHYGPFGSCSDALRRAVGEARAAGTYGFASAVLVRSSVGGPFAVHWADGRADGCIGAPPNPGDAGLAPATSARSRTFPMEARFMEARACIEAHRREEPSWG